VGPPRVGVFDPWRSTDVVPAEAEGPPSVEDIHNHEIGEPVMRVVRFDGLRAGINVRILDGDYDDAAASEAARARLVDAVYRLAAVPEIREAKLFTSWRIYLSDESGDSFVRLTDGKRWVTIVSAFPGPQVVQRSVDALALAFREAVRYTGVGRANVNRPAEILSALRIKPHVK
jgi:hypothetical protein